MRRRPAEPGHRPRAGVRFAAGTCRACGAAYVLDRQTQPWARARTCSASCAKRLANHDRHPGTCRHCQMVTDYHLARDAELRAHERPGQDEDNRLITFREWLQWFEWEPWDEEPGVA